MPLKGNQYIVSTLAIFLEFWTDNNHDTIMRFPIKIPKYKQPEKFEITCSMFYMVQIAFTTQYHIEDKLEFKHSLVEYCSSEVFL
jgi:hypothetical protein